MEGQLSERLAHLARLPAGWNSYKAVAISEDAIAAARELLARFPEGTPIPCVVPTVRGGVQLEWHAGGVDIEVYVGVRGDLKFFAGNAESGEEFEGSAHGNEALLEQWISRVGVALGSLVR